MFWYHLMHSVWITLILFLLGLPAAAVGHLLHIVCDWFTHTGRFAAMPLYPCTYPRLTFGKDILK